MNFLLSLVLVSVVSSDCSRQIQNEIGQYDHQLGLVLNHRQQRLWLEQNNQSISSDNFDYQPFFEQFLWWASSHYHQLHCSQSVNPPCNYFRLAIKRFSKQPSSPELFWMIPLLRSVSNQLAIKHQGKFYQGEDSINRLLQTANPVETKIIWKKWNKQLEKLSPLFGLIRLSISENFKYVWHRWNSDLEIEPVEAVLPLAHRLWSEVEWFYRLLHDYLIEKLSPHYRNEFQGRIIPLHILKSLTGTQFDAIFELVKPFSELDTLNPLKSSSNISELIDEAQKIYVDLGFEKVPESIWKASSFTGKGCHAVTVDFFNTTDTRIRMCLDSDPLVRLIHELGHVYYFQSYSTTGLNLYKMNVNTAVHESIGDTIRLFSTGCGGQTLNNHRVMINTLLQEALVTFVRIPYALSLEQWRYEVFQGEKPPAAMKQINDRYWKIRRQIGGVGPNQANQKQIDPLAKFHITNFMPYLRYLFATFLTHQFHEVICDQHSSRSLFECCPDPEKLAQFRNLLKHGASDPVERRQAYSELTGDAKIIYRSGSLLNYYKPLIDWLVQRKENRGFI